MPQIYCNIPAGVPADKKREMIREIVQVVHETCDSDPEIINVIVYEVERSNMAVNGRVDEPELAKAS